MSLIDDKRPATGQAGPPPRATSLLWPAITDRREVDRHLIECARFFCIFFMMYSHFGLFVTIPTSAPSALEGLQQLNLTNHLYILFGDGISETAGALLGFVAGYLGYRTYERYAYREVVRKKAWALYFPIVFWSAAYAVTRKVWRAVWPYDGPESNALIDNDLTAQVLQPTEATEWWSPAFRYLDQLFALTGLPYAYPLHYLRDLFLCFVFVPLLAVIIRRRAYMLAFFALLLLTGVHQQTIFLRVELLIFFTFGLWACKQGIKVENIVEVARGRMFWWAIGALGFIYAHKIVGYHVALNPDDPFWQAVFRVTNIMRRVCLALLFFSVFARLPFDRVKRLGFFGRFTFATFCVHLFVFLPLASLADLAFPDRVNNLTAWALYTLIPIAGYSAGIALYYLTKAFSPSWLDYPIAFNRSKPKPAMMQSGKVTT